MAPIDRSGRPSPKMGPERKSPQGQGPRRPKRENDRNGVANINTSSPKEVMHTPNGRVPPGGRTHHNAPSSIMPDHDEVLAAVDSLYTDQLKPFGRILRKRIAERAVGGFVFADGDAGLPDVDIKHLRNVCVASEILDVVPEEGGDWSALLRGREPNFVNVYSPCDTYEPELWDQASQYFQNLSEEEMCLPGGRYSCAQALTARQLPFLAQRSLGEVCHIVQLAISQKRLLGYFSGAVVPYSRSQSMVKEWCAYKGAPCTSAAPATSGALPLATWEEAREHLKAILESVAVPPTPGVVPLSNVKRLFRSRYQVELSETMLGYSKLSELLQDQRLNDICTVQLQGHGYIVVQNFPSPSTTARPVSLANALPPNQLGEPLRLGADAAIASPVRTVAPPQSAKLAPPQESQESPPRSPTSPQPPTLAARAARSTPLTVETASSAQLSNAAPCRVELGCDSPLRPQNWARRNRGERELEQSTEVTELLSPSISPHYTRMRNLWPATPDHSPCASRRYSGYGSYEGGMPSLTPSLSQVHAAQKSPQELKSQDLLQTPCSSLELTRVDRDQDGMQTQEYLDEPHYQTPAKRPQELADATPVGSPPVGSRDDVRISSPKHGVPGIQTASISTESTADFSPARSPNRAGEVSPMSPTFRDEPMKVRVAPQSPVVGDNSLGGGHISGSLSPTRSKGMPPLDGGLESPTRSSRMQAAMLGLPGQPQILAESPSASKSPARGNTFFQMEGVDRKHGSFTQTQPSSPKKGIGACSSPKKGIFGDDGQQVKLSLASLV